MPDQSRTNDGHDSKLRPAAALLSAVSIYNISTAFFLCTSCTWMYSQVRRALVGLCT
jgi:hypothetical protein